MVAGGTAAAITTPLDCIKTRIMLSNKPADLNLFIHIFHDLRKQGPRAFFAGVGPRVMWISIGGSIFLGAYDGAMKLCSTIL
jgi:solute carrier family 25 S-adenosylmethionine transporter 26